MLRSNFTDTVLYLFLRAFGWFCRILTRKSAMTVGSVLGKILYRLLKQRRQIALNNLHIAFGENTDEDERERVCIESFVNFSKTIIEFLRFKRFNEDNIWDEVTVYGAENIEDSLAKGKGAIVFLPHFGNWELLSLVYGVLIPNQANAIAFPLRYQRINSYIWNMREHLGMKLIPRKNAIRATMRAIKNNEAIGFFSDQNAGDQGVFIDFFGKAASSARAPVTLALKTGTPILFSLDIRQPDDTHHVHISPPLYLEPTEDKENDIKTYTTLLMKQLEDYIQKYPEQWLWIHNRWKTQPVVHTNITISN